MIERLRRTTKEQLYSWLIGFGLIITVIHNPNQPLAHTRFLFLPILGLVIILFCSIDYYLDLKKREEIDLGSKWLWIPLVIIVFSIIARPVYTLITGDGVVIDRQPKGMAFEITNAAIIIGLFALYVTSKKLGTKVFTPLAIGLIIATISTVYGYFVTGLKNGGIISPTNYDIAAGFILFVLLVSSYRHRWWLSAIALVGIFFTGADEGLFCLILLAIFVVVRRDWSKKILLPIGTLILLLAICTPLGITSDLWMPAAQKVSATKQVMQETPIGEIANKIVPDSLTKEIDKAKPVIETTSVTNTDWLDEATNNRWTGYWKLSPIKPLGYGYNINQFYVGIPHNVPMIIIEQIGILGALAWCIVAIYCLIKSKWKYAWLGFIAMGVFDHYTWTMAAPWFWALVGVSSSNSLYSRYLFREE